MGSNEKMESPLALLTGSTKTATTFQMVKTKTLKLVCISALKWTKYTSLILVMVATTVDITTEASNSDNSAQSGSQFGTRTI